jgi:vacuolar-type H+-ATPase subunit E/Vma4
MSNFEKLQSAILKEAEEKASIVIAEGKAQSNVILGEAKSEASKLRKDGEIEAVQDGKAHKERLILSAQRAQQTRILEAKHQQTEEVFQELKTFIGAMAPREYQELLVRLVLREELRPGDYELVVAEKDSGRINDQFVDMLNGVLNGKDVRLEFKGGTARIDGGLILKGQDLEENLSIDSLLRMRREELVQVAMEVLFPGSGE